jgi:hypothetical protein
MIAGAIWMTPAEGLDDDTEGLKLARVLLRDHVDRVDARNRERIADLDVGIGRRRDRQVRVAVVDVDRLAERIDLVGRRRVVLVRAVDGRGAAGRRREVEVLVVLVNVEAGNADAELAFS